MVIRAPIVFIISFLALGWLRLCSLPIPWTSVDWFGDITCSLLMIILVEVIIQVFRLN